MELNCTCPCIAPSAPHIDLNDRKGDPAACVKCLDGTAGQWVCMSIFNHGYAYGPLCGELQPWFGKPHQYECDFRSGEEEREGGACYDVPATL
ncbi:Pre-mRNA-splicing factor [Venturia inaequalis]|nr:Pre-mRNA-splicing factor [Venturia inaequalis]